jgi:branched-chain amino acid transport system permease protein
MSSVVLGASVAELKAFLVLGLALGGVFAVSGVGIVVLYQATGVVNLAYGAIGAVGAFLSWTLVNDTGWPAAACFLVSVAFGGVSTLVYGALFGPALAHRDALVKAIATLGLALIFLGITNWVWQPGVIARTITLPTTQWSYSLSGVFVNWTQIMALLFGIVVTVGTAVFLRTTPLGTAMRSLANDREITAMLGVPVRRVEAAAWFGSGLICGASGLFLAELVGLDPTTLTFLVISSLAAALIGGLRSLWITLLAGLVIGIAQSELQLVDSIQKYRTMTPFVLAIIALLWIGRRRVVVISRVAR